MTSILPESLQIQTAFALSPSYLAAGDELLISPQTLAGSLLGGAPLTLELVEVDDQGASPFVVARFKVEVRRGSLNGPLAFTQVRREDVEGGEPGDWDEAGPKSDTSPLDGETFPFETTWKRAEFKLSFEGLVETKHTVVVRKAGGRDTKNAEGLVYELGLRVATADGALAYDSGTQFVTFDCWNAMTHNCAAAAQTMLQGHHYLIETRGYGDHYGSECSAPTPGAAVTSCTNYCLQVLQRAYEELGATADNRLLKGAQQDGTQFAKKIFAAGWKLVYMVKSKQEFDGIEPDAYGGLEWITHHVFKRQRLRVISAGEMLADVPVEETVHSYGGEGVDPAGSARFDDLSGAPFMILALDLGFHMCMKVGERVYECHYTHSSSESNLFDRGGSSWASLKSGSDSMFYAAVPPASLDLSFPGKTEDERKQMLEPEWDKICVLTGSWTPSDV